MLDYSYLAVKENKLMNHQASVPLRVLVDKLRKSVTTVTQCLLDSEFICCHLSETKIKSWGAHINMYSEAQHSFYYQADTFEAYGVNPESYWEEVVVNCQTPGTAKEYIDLHSVSVLVLTSQAYR